MKRKLVSVLLCISLVGAMVGGCGKKDDLKEDVETLSVWVPPLDEATEKNWSPLLKKFEEKNNCKVELTIVPWDNYGEAYTTAINAEEGPDVGYLYNELYPGFIEGGAVADLTEYFSEDDYKEYRYLERAEMMDGLYGCPIVTGVPFVLYYNQDILDELGEVAPDTWEDFMRICEKATKDTDGDGKVDQYGMAMGLNAGDFSPLYIMNAYYYSSLWQAGGDIYSDDLKTVSFNDEAGKKAMEFIKGWVPYIPEDYMSLAASDVFTTTFGEGKSAFAVTRSSQTDDTNFKKLYPELNWNFVTSLKGEQYGAFGAADSLALMSACDNKDLAVKLIKYICSSEFMTEYHKKSPGASLTISEEYVGDAKMEKIYNEDIDKWRGLQAGPCGNEILQYLGSQIQAILSGDKSVDAGLADAETYANQVLDEYWADQN